MNMIRTVIALILMGNNGLFGDLEVKLHGLGTLKDGYGVARDNEEYPGMESRMPQGLDQLAFKCLTSVL